MHRNFVKENNLRLNLRSDNLGFRRFGEEKIPSFPPKMASFTHLSPSSLIIHPIPTPKLSFRFCFLKPAKTFVLTCTSQCQQDSNLSSNPKSKRPSMDGRTPTSKRVRKPSHGTSRRSILKKSFNQEQVTFSTPLSDDPTVGIIGGGMAGMICALNLEKRGIRSTVFDTGVHGLGGRMGTRVIEPQGLIFDHAAQFFTVSDPQFAELVNGWLGKDVVQEWQGPIGELEVGGRFVPLPPQQRYIGVGGMRPLADSLLSQTAKIDVARPCWISKIEPFNGMWHLSENGKPRGQFDAIVIAHNGKCANRLLATSGLPLIARQMKRLELSSIWALLAAFEDPLPCPVNADTLPFEGAFVKGVDSISWMGNNTKKLLGSSNGGRPHCWTFLSTATFGKRNKVPQENIPTTTAEKVKKTMLEGVEAALGVKNGSLPRPFYTRLQLWGAALPMNSPGVPCIFDPLGRAGICGDWLLGSNLESAALSGMSLANHIADYFESGGSRPEEFAIGLNDEFQSLDGHDIGQFAGLKGSFSKDESDKACQQASPV